MANNFFVGIPEENIIHILSFLDIHDLNTLQRVSKELRRFAKDGLLWRNLCQSWYGFKPTTDAMNKFIMAYLFERIKNCYHYGNIRIEEEDVRENDHFVLLNPEKIEDTFHFLNERLTVYAADESDKECCGFANYALGILAFLTDRTNAEKFFIKAANNGNVDAAIRWCIDYYKYHASDQDPMLIRRKLYLQMVLNTLPKLALYNCICDPFEAMDLTIEQKRAHFIKLKELADKGNAAACEFIATYYEQILAYRSDFMQDDPGAFDEQTLEAMRRQTAALRFSQYEHYAKIASKNGYHRILICLARLTLTGGLNPRLSQLKFGITPNYEKAKQYFLLALQNDCPLAGLELAKLELLGFDFNEENFINNPIFIQATAWLEQGAQLRCPYDLDSVACAVLLIDLHENNLKFDPAYQNTINQLFNKMQNLFKYYDLAYMIGRKYCILDKPELADKWFEKTFKDNKISLLQKLYLAAAISERVTELFEKHNTSVDKEQGITREYEKIRIKWDIRCLVLHGVSSFDATHSHNYLYDFIRKNRRNCSKPGYTLFKLEDVTLDNLRALEELCADMLNVPYTPDDCLETLFALRTVKAEPPAKPSLAR